MPDGLHPREFEPVENRRKSRLQQGGLGSPVMERQPHFCTHCKKQYQWTPDLDSTDFGDVIDNLCPDCRVILRQMRTNHPEMK
jgi:hypothetical protein